MRSCLFVAVLLMSTLHAADGPPAAEVIKGVNIYVELNTGEAQVNKIGAEHVLLTVVVPPAGAEKEIDNAIDQLKKLKEAVKEDLKAKKEAAKRGDKLPAPDLTTEQKYRSKTKAKMRPAEASSRLLTFEEFMVLRSQPHVSEAYVDPSFVPRCKGGVCEVVKSLK